MKTARQGVALVQALVIVAALAALALALVQRGEGATARLAGRLLADQAGLYLDSGLDLAREGLPSGVVHRGQDWARPHEGIIIGDGILAWRIEDLQGRFNLGWIVGSDRMRQAFDSLARAQGLTGDEIDDALQFGQRLRNFDWFPADAIVRMIPAADSRATARLAPLITTLPADRLANIHTLRPEVLAALAPELDESVRAAILRQVTTATFATKQTFLDWARDALGESAEAILAALPLGVGSESFGVRIEVRLDTLRLARSGVIDTGDVESGRAFLRLAHPVHE